MLRKGPMQQGLLIEGDGDVTKRDMTPRIKIEEEELSPPESDDDEDILQMYANASRNISKRILPRLKPQFKTTVRQRLRFRSPSLGEGYGRTEGDRNRHLYAIRFGREGVE